MSPTQTPTCDPSKIRQMSNALPAQSITLERIAPGDCADISHLDVEQDLRLRLLALGMRVGNRVKVLRRGAWGGPLHIRVGTTEVILRQQDAHRVGVIPVDPD